MLFSGFQSNLLSGDRRIALFRPEGKANLLDYSGTINAYLMSDLGDEVMRRRISGPS